jgi:serine/threonine protein phosphatase PrpC
MLSRHVLPDPIYLHIFFGCQEQQITEEVEFLVIASDGLWDVISNEVCGKNEIRDEETLDYDYCQTH